MKDLNLKYKYVFLNATDGNLFEDNINGYYYICAKDLETCQNVYLFSAILKNRNKFLRFLCKLHLSRKINKIIRLPLKKIWYPLFYDFKELDESPICFVLNNFQLPFDYLLYLKKRFPNAKFVKIHRDLIRYFYERYPGYSKEKCDHLFDLNLSYDEQEAKELGWPAFEEFESRIDVPTNEFEIKYDVFFVGRAKDRLQTLLDVYKKLSSLGLKCHFYITGVPSEKRNKYPGIVFADKNMSYKEMLLETICSNCVLDINQGGAIGFTSRFLEAIIYNKKLLTNNKGALNSKFYNPEYIQYFDERLSFDGGFFNNEMKVDYKYNNEFSPIQLIKKIDEIIIHEDGNKK